MRSFPETYNDPLWCILFGCRKCGYIVNGREYSKGFTVTSPPLNEIAFKKSTRHHIIVLQ